MFGLAKSFILGWCEHRNNPLYEEHISKNCPSVYFVDIVRGGAPVNLQSGVILIQCTQSVSHLTIATSCLDPWTRPFGFGVRRQAKRNMSSKGTLMQCAP